jgi:autotransporter-associated beta strand protein
VTVTTNTGSIIGAAAGITTSGVVNVTNDSGGQIKGAGSAGVAINAGTSITAANAGIISGGTNGALLSSGAITVTSNTGTISSTNPGIATIAGGTATVVNSGSITATGAGSVAIVANGLNITNNAGATISGANDGVNQQAGGTATIANTGTISGAGRTGLRLGSNASVTNTGTGVITGLTGIGFRDPLGVNTPVVNGSVFNSGTITGTGGTAINFAITPGSGPFTLTLGPGSIIQGNVLGTGGDLFQLGGAAGSDTFNVTTIGAAQQYRGFTTFNKIGASTWTLTGSGAQNWTISQGTLIGDTNSLAGSAITNNAALVYSQNFDGVHSGVISGSGSLTKSGSGNVILAADNVYSGGTTISAGTLQLGNGGTTGSIQGDVLDNGVFAINRSNAYTFGGVISGNGAFQQIGGATTTLTATNTYAGGTTITGGTLQLGNGGTTGSIIGNVTDNAVFAINHSNAFTFGGVISGTGAFQQNGPGTTVLTATNSFTGTTTVNGGTLQVDGSIASSSLTTVNANAALTGAGTVGNTAIANGGMFAPGSGTPGSFMTVSGNLAFQSGAQYLVQLNPTTSSFTRVTGTATLGNATVDAVYANGNYVEKRYTIVTAGNISGTFNSTVVNTNLPSNLHATLNYDATHAFLDLVLNFTPSPFGIPTGLNGNQQQVGNALTNFFNSTGGIPMAFAALTPAGLTQASGEAATGTQQTTFDAMNQFMGLLTDPFIAGRGDPVTSSTGAPAFAEENGVNAYAADVKARSKRLRCHLPQGACDGRHLHAALERLGRRFRRFANHGR